MTFIASNIVGGSKTLWRSRAKFSARTTMIELKEVTANNGNLTGDAAFDTNSPKPNIGSIANGLYSSGGHRPRFGTFNLFCLIRRFL